MRIDVLYFEGCPNHPPVVAMIERLVATNGVDAEIREVEVAPENAQRLRFLGSPTVQVDGIDIEPAARANTEFGMSCRWYGTPDGLPPEQMVAAALGVSAEGSAPARHDRAGMWSIGGSLATALLSSACCWVPLLLLTFGASAAGFGTIFERWRPVFIVTAIVMLGLSFYTVYFRGRQSTCCDGASCERGGRPAVSQQIALWASVVMVAGFVSFPVWGHVLVDSGRTVEGASLPDVEGVSMTLGIEGMTCAGCEVHVERALMKTPGVLAVDADHAARSAVLLIDATEIPDRPSLEAAVNRAGYTLLSEH